MRGTVVLIGLAILSLVGGCSDDEEQPGAPATAANVFPADGATGIPPNVTLIWTTDAAPVKALRYYRVFLGGGPGNLAHAATTTEPHLVRRGLALGSTYWWAVEAVGDGDRTSYGGPWSFAVDDELRGPVVTRTLGGEAWTAPDTVGHGAPVVVTWSARSAYLDVMSGPALAFLDTVPPFDDGILGYRWALSPVLEYPDSALWSPPGYEMTTSFLGNDPQAEPPYRDLGAAAYWLLVDALDVNGARVPVSEQIGTLVVNHDPDTQIERSAEYPYYEVYRSGVPERFTFSDGDTVPDGAYVVLRALGWDDARDQLVAPTNQVALQGYFRARGLYGGYAPYEFASSASAPHQTPPWIPADPAGVVADTLGFLVGPFDYTVKMRAIDEHGRRDGTPDSLRFTANFPPCVQCVELINLDTEPTYPVEGDCWNRDCFDGETLLVARRSGQPAGPAQLSVLDADAFVWVEPRAHRIEFDVPLDPTGYAAIPVRMDAFVAYLHGQNHPHERWSAAHADRRIAAWYYEVDYEADEYDLIRDGGGYDDIGTLCGFPIEGNVPDPWQSDLFIDGAGVWGVRVRVAVPQSLLDGPQDYWDDLLAIAPAPAPPAPGAPVAEICAWQQLAPVQTAYQVWRLTTMQFSPAAVQAIASDVSRCDWRRQTNMYHWYDGVRVPEQHGWLCRENAYPNELGALDLEYFPAPSNGGEPVTKRFRVEVETATGPFSGGNPPGWIDDCLVARLR